jgi:hypothetical protein
VWEQDSFLMQPIPMDFLVEFLFSFLIAVYYSKIVFFEFLETFTCRRT